MAKPILDDAQLDALRKYDTPTVCNALDILLPNERKNFNTASLFCAFPKLPPMVGYAKTAMVRSTQPTLNTPEQHMKDRFNYWTYLSKGPFPAISVIQDLDGAEAGYGAFWGEVNSNAHKALGCIGTITDNSIRDLDEAVFPSTRARGCSRPPGARRSTGFVATLGGRPSARCSSSKWPPTSEPASRIPGRPWWTSDSP